MEERLVWVRVGLSWGGWAVNGGVLRSLEAYFVVPEMWFVVLSGVGQGVGPSSSNTSLVTWQLSGGGRGGLTRGCGAADGRGGMLVGPCGFGVAADGGYSTISGDNGATVISDMAHITGPLADSGGGF